MAVTMRDVALKAGVSIKTVSRVVNNQGEITEATRQRVIEAITELGYRPSRVARALVTQSTCTVGLVVPDISNPFFPEMARGVLDFAQERDYNVFLCNTDAKLEQERSTLNSLVEHAVDGIMMYPTYDSRENLTALANTYRPLVVINYHFEHLNSSQIMVNNQLGARLAVDYLVSKGHQKIAMLTGVQDPERDRVRRIQGFREAIEMRNLPADSGFLAPGNAPTFADGYSGAQNLLTRRPDLTAIFAYNDLLAMGAMRACSEMGRRVPEDCAIVGFDDISMASMVTPSLTSIRTDKYELGRVSMRRLLDMLENPTKTFEPIYMDMELVIRESA